MKTVQSSDGTEIAYDTTGDGPPLVIVAGAFGNRGSKRPLSALLAPRFTVFAYDRRGRGDSAGGSATTVDQEVHDLLAVLSVAPDAVVFGDSSGGALVIEAAAAGARVRGLAVYEVPYTPGPTTAMAERLDELVDTGRAGEAVTAFFELMGMPPAAIGQLRSGPQWGYLERFAGTLSADVRLCNGGELPVDKLKAIQVPLLAMAGGASHWAVDVARAMAAVALHGDAQILEAQGHAVADDVLAGALMEFVQ